MEVEVWGSIRFGCVFSREDVESALQKASGQSACASQEAPEKKRKRLDIESAFDEALYEQTRSRMDVRELVAVDSVDFLSGEDYAEEVYIYLSNKGSDCGAKGGDIEVLDREAFVVAEEDIEYMDKQLQKLELLGLEKKRGWIFRTYLD